jgi:hypothetical protein
MNTTESETLSADPSLTAQQRYTLAIDTLIQAQTLIINYSKKDVWNYVVWGGLFLAFSFMSYDLVWLAAINLILAGINFHKAVNEHGFLKTWQQDLIALKAIERLNDVRNRELDNSTEHSTLQQ